MTKRDLIRILEGLSEDQFRQIAPFLEADLEAANELIGLQHEVDAGRQSAETSPLLDAQDVYRQVRAALDR